MRPSPLVLDDIVKILAHKDEQVPLVGYPKDDSGVDFELYTARHLNLLIGRAAKYYQRLLPIEATSEPIVSLVGPSDLDYLIAKFALSRIGFGVLLLSTRLTPEACLKLMKENDCRTVIQAPSRLALNLGVRTHDLDSSVSVYKIATRDIYRDTSWDSQALYRSELDAESASQRTAIVYHSSGSTGLPKSIATTHRKLLAPIPTGNGTSVLTSSPLCHAFASKLTINCMMVEKCMYLTNANMPLTAQTLTEVCRIVQPQVFLTVPYVLKLMAETNNGVSELTKCKSVVSSGSQLSDELGDRLVEAGVNIEVLFAGTEPGMVGSSINRPSNDNAWNYFRLVPAVQQNVQYKPLGNNTFELVYLSTLPTLNMSNSDDPPGSFHSSDIVTPHPAIPNAWKYVGRVDDRISLSTGEKVLPLPMEGRVRQEAFVREAVVFGINRSIPGLLVFKADAARGMSDEQFISAIWSAIKAANAKAEAFGRIGREMVVCLPMDAQIPMADKQSIIRSKVYKMYEQQIQRAYDMLECGSQGGLQLSLPELERFILELVHEQISIDISDAETEFHQAGMDSLQAIRLRSLILSKVAVKAGKKLSQNVVFESGNVKRLAVRIHCSGNNEQQDEAEDGIPLMQNLISEFSTFSPHTPGSRHMSSASVVLLTGATGSLGAHLLSELLSSTTVSEVFCIVRGSEPLLRLHHALKSRNLPQDRLRHKVKVINSDIFLSNLDMDDATVSILKHKLTHVIHAAWPVNFQLGLHAFKPQLQILHSLLQLCLSVTSSQPAKLIFCSSISVALATAPPAYIPETAVVKIEQAQATGYARSKLVSERILEVAISSAGARAQVLRIGQVVGDTRHGLWNDSEAWPLVIRSALTLKTLPAFDMMCSWLPVDVLAKTILEVGVEQDCNRENPFLNIENPCRFHWTRDLLAELKKKGLEFETENSQIWLRRLTEYQNKTPDESTVQQNPAVKLSDYFEQLVDNLHRESTGDGREVTFDTTKARNCSEHLQNAPDVLATGLVGKFLENWMAEWQHKRWRAS